MDESQRLEFTLQEREYRVFKNSLRSLSKIGKKLMIHATPDEASDLAVADMFDLGRNSLFSPSLRRSNSSQ